MKEIKWKAVEADDAPGCSKIVDMDGYSITGVISTNIAHKIVMLNNRDIFEKQQIDIAV